MYRPADFDPVNPIFLSPWSWNSVGPKLRAQYTTAPASGAWPAANRAFHAPFFVHQPYSLARMWWLNGATVGTDSLQAAVLNDAGEVVVASPLTLSAGTANQVQYATCAVNGYPVISGSGSGTSTTTSSATIRARPGWVYVLVVGNVMVGGSANTVTAATTSGAITFTSRATTQFNGTQERVTMFTAVASADVTDTITITIGSGQSSGATGYQLVVLTNVDTTTNHGIVQTATGTGNSTTPLATLSAFGSADNGTFAVHANAGTNNATPGTNFTEISDSTAAPLGIETAYYSGNDTTADATILSSQWGSLAAEVKSLGTTRTLAPGRYYLSLGCTGTTATVFRVSSAPAVSHLGVYITSTSAYLGATAAFAASTNSVLPVFGITSRATP